MNHGAVWVCILLNLGRKIFLKILNIHMCHFNKFQIFSCEIYRISTDEE